ncbi:EamA-like transporter family protein [Rhodobacterales bacterium HKCCE2091]|nr:EamA-like transporter family protein [Rhodobacterales bacterium HKCCE2091]
MPHHALIMLLSGIGIPLLAALNARLGQNIGSPAVAALVLFVVALSMTAIVVAVTGGAGALRDLGEQPKVLFTAGLLVAFYILSITYIAPAFGIGNAVFFVLIGQLVSAAAIDHFGLFGARVSPLSPMRTAGLAVMAVGVALTQFAPRN